ncbi:MAG: YlbG family protein [Vagococcus sp.]|nr:YlbG family protein [Vagococcus sp. DIV0080]
MLDNNMYDTLDVIPRRGLIVWVYSLKQLKNLRRFGYVHHVSRKQKYVVLYVDEVDVDSTIERLEKQFFVRSVDKSMRPDINMNFDNRLGNKVSDTNEPVEFEEQNTEIVLADFVQ